MKFSIKYFFSKCDQIRRLLRIWSHLLKKYLMESFIFCVALKGKLSSREKMLQVQDLTFWLTKKNLQFIVLDTADVHITTQVKFSKWIDKKSVAPSAEFQQIHQQALFNRFNKNWQNRNFGKTGIWCYI